MRTEAGMNTYQSAEITSYRVTGNPAVDAFMAASFVSSAKISGMENALEAAAQAGAKLGGRIQLG